ncbi:MAG: TonB-dependent receptor [Bacteroidota bacterium]|nr:TonB-dependent receptor [Bacteroidota bacterium]MDP4254515.1 TonB-dependent receptor [Bacteroidota bacterium]MDP4260674.1 TonB-dependent receptor [Bacteroidota bacterium]
MLITRCLPSSFGRTMILFLILLCWGSAMANVSPRDRFAEVYITIKESHSRLLPIFELIQRQTPLVFVYDEGEINLTQKLKLPIGQQRLSDLLETISNQTGLAFTQKQNSILVTRQVKLSQTMIVLQSIPVKGSVRDANGKPLPGATISVKGTQISAQADADGNFSINAASNAVLVVSYIGYKSIDIEMNGRSELVINLEEVKKDLNEVVVMGYQDQKRSAIAGAVTTVNVDNVAKIPTGFADQALQGQVSGVRITQSSGQPGDGLALRVRGVGSVNNNDPLYVIDGVPTQDGINFLAADDIASITVLKDAASAAIYGARSSNGVVVITTKNGKSGRTSINYSVYAGIQTHGYLTPMVNASEYKTLFNEMVANDNAGLAPNNPLLKSPIPDSIQMANTDWLGSIFRTAPEQDHELSVSGGNEKTQYAVSGNFFKQDGIILNSFYDRYTLRTKLITEVSAKLKVGANLSFSFYDKNSIGSSGDGLGGNGGSVVRYALFRDPAIPVFISPGLYSDLPQYPGFFGDGYNPVGLANNTSNTEKQFRGFGDVFAEYKILDNLIFKSDFGGDVLLTQGKTFDLNWGTNGRVNNPNTLVERQITNQNMIWNNTFRYRTLIRGVHNFNFLIGTEAIANTTTNTTESQQHFPTQIPSLEFLGNGLSPGINTEGEGQWALMSFLANVNYSYNSEFFVSGSARRDGSSRFGPTNRWGNFFSGAVAWNLLSEKWFSNLFPGISGMKLRASYGQLGNQNIGDYPWASIVESALRSSNVRNYVLGSPPLFVQGMTVSTLGNTDVKWETSTQTDVGADISILDDKLSLVVDYFNKVNSNMLVAVPLPMIGGSANAPFVNDGSVQNKGFEFELRYRNMDHRLKYSFNANLATIQNKVISIPVPIQGGRIDNGIYATLTTAGHPLGSFYGYEMTGIMQNKNDIFTSAYQGPGVRPGDVKYKDVNGDGKIDAKDRLFLGSAIPKFTYGLATSLNYMDFDMFILFQGGYGNKIYMQVNQDIEGFYRPFNLTQRVYDTRWHGEATSNTMPLVSWLDQPNNIKEPSSRFIEDASYCRLKNVQIGYNLPKKLLAKLRVKGLRFYMTGSNLITITKYPGLDPEMHTSNNVNVERYPSDVAAGIDWGTYPSAKSYLLGANLNF